MSDFETTRLRHAIHSNDLLTTLQKGDALSDVDNMEERIEELETLLKAATEANEQLKQQDNAVLENVVGQSEQLACDCDRQPLRYNELGICKYCGKQKPSEG